MPEVRYTPVSVRRPKCQTSGLGADDDDSLVQT